MANMGSFEHQKGTTECCPADVNGNGNVNATDLAELPADWGPTPPGNCLDSDQDGDIDSADLAELLAAWGACS